MAQVPQIFNKTAKSSDPVQQALRDHKKRWNTAFKEFKKRMSAFSQGLNGKGNPSYGLPPSDIKDPLPEEDFNFLNNLAADFQQLAEEALRIQQEQASYSKNRRQPAKDKLEASIKVATASEKTYVKIEGKAFPTLLAITSQEQEKGLMYQDWPPPIMSFIYSSPRINKFWMKNTPSPLDIIFSLNGKITAIHAGEPFSTQAIGDDSETDLIVELPHGTCQKNGIRRGDSIFITKRI